MNYVPFQEERPLIADREMPADKLLSMTLSSMKVRDKGSRLIHVQNFCSTYRA
jgi:hypothetical protein